MSRTHFSELAGVADLQKVFSRIRRPQPRIGEMLDPQRDFLFTAVEFASDGDMVSKIELSAEALLAGQSPARGSERRGPFAAAQRGRAA